MARSLAQEAHPLLAELPEETLRRLEIYANLLEKRQRAVTLARCASTIPIVREDCREIGTAINYINRL
jgi:hypothetical protein